MTPPGSMESFRFGPLVAALLLALAAYVNATANGFAQDDALLIERNPQIQSLENLPALFASDLFGGAYPAAMYYRPLVLASFALEYAVAGPSPFLYHLTNVLLHAVACGLLFALALGLLGSPTLAFLAAALFAVHPVHTEAVAAISGRGDLLGTVFLLAGACLYARRPGSLASGAALATLVCVLLALLSKESSLLGLALFPLIDIVQGGARPLLEVLRAALRSRSGLWLGLVVVIAIYAMVREVVTADAVSMSAPGFMGNRYASELPFGLKLATCAKLLGIYFRLLVFPHPLSADYDFDQVPLADEPFALSSLLPGVATVALGVAALRSRRGAPGVFFGIAFLLIGLLPIALLLPFANIPLAERYLYLPSLGLCVAVAALVARVPARARLTSLVAMGLLVILPAGVHTALRNRDWRDDHTLWAVTVRTSPNSAKARANRALSLASRAEARAGDAANDASQALFREAASHYERSLQIDPQVPDVRFQYGLCLAALGHYARAEAELLAAAELGRAEALIALYRILVGQSLQHAEAAPRLALDFQRRAERVFRERIRPVSPPEHADILAREIEALERQLAEARAGESLPPP